jgi:hypothetical protein
MRLLTRYAVKNQYVASTAAYAFAPKLAMQTLISPDHSMGAAPRDEAVLEIVEVVPDSQVRETLLAA